MRREEKEEEEEEKEEEGGERVGEADVGEEENITSGHRQHEVLGDFAS